ncbi:Alpha/Beta hydrolase protein [Xylariales sp. AK1849]|nr:Alpha/Beta hydrolase protein [Xylariales sp. AK1849]
MPSFTSPVDSTRLFYRYHVPDDVAFRPHGPRIQPLSLVFLHGWPMSSRMWEHLLLPLCESYRFPCIAPDRRGFGQSDWNSSMTSSTLTWDVFTDDLVGLIKHLDVDSFVFVGASMGCPESLLAYQSSEFIRERCKGFIWIGPVMPYPLQTPEHPLSPSRELWDSILDGFRKNRTQYVAESLPGVFAVEAGNSVSPKVLAHFERVVAEADGIAIEKTVSIFNQPTETQLKWLHEEDREIPIMILHGDADQGMPLEASAQIIKEMLPWVELNVYRNGGHGLYITHASQVLDHIEVFVGNLSLE